jgi:hypothetical protein
MDTSEVMDWVARYEAAWRDDDLAAVDGLFTAQARYLRSPYDAQPLVGRPAIRGFWSDPTPFEMTAEPEAVQGRRAVVRVEVRYGGDEPQEYRDLWVLRFADDGRVEHFEEWPFWPGQPWTAGHPAEPSDATGPD